MDLEDANEIASSLHRYLDEWKWQFAHLSEADQEAIARDPLCPIADALDDSVYAALSMGEIAEKADVGVPVLPPSRASSSGVPRSPSS